MDSTTILPLDGEHRDASFDLAIDAADDIAARWPTCYVAACWTPGYGGQVHIYNFQTRKHLLIDGVLPIMAFRRHIWEGGVRL